MRKFKTKRKIKLLKIYKFIIFILLIFFLFKFFKFKFNFKLNDVIIKYILNDNNYISDNNYLKNFLSKTTEGLINKPNSLLATNFYYKRKKDMKKEEVVIKKNDNLPLVYLYNSHQQEGYTMDYMEDYNINPTVLTVDYILQERLEKLGVNVIVEENDISKYLSDNKMKYYESYDASRYYLLSVMEKYDSIKLFIDIHRDAISHDLSTININGNECAKIMFVVGKEHDNYLHNLDNAKYLNEMISNKWPTLSRGVLEKEGKNVNGIYNQDLSENIMLIEIGGNYNNISEVLNTIDLIAPIIGEYVNEKR